MGRLTPDEEQQAAIDRMAADTSGGAMVAAGLGAGKTLLVAETIKARGARTVLIMGPVTVKVVLAWEERLRLQGVDLPFRRITSKTPDVFKQLRDGVPGVYYIGREYLGRTEYPIDKVFPDMAVAEEAHFATNRKAQRTKALRRVKAAYKICLSATPYGNKFEGFYPLVRWLWPDLVDRSFYRWRDKWCETTFDAFAFDKKKVVGEKYPGRYVTLMPTYIYIEPQHVDVAVRKVYVDLHPTQRELYDQMEADLIAWVDDNPMVASVPIVQKTRLRQITLGVPTITEAGEVDFHPNCHSTKLDALEQILDNETGQVIVYVESERIVKAVLHRIPNSVAWTGADSCPR